MNTIIADYGMAKLMTNNIGATILELNFYSTFIGMLLTLILGRLITQRSHFLRHYDIPEPVTGGIIVAFVLFLSSYFMQFTVKFDTNFQTPLLLAFYATVGLTADINSLKKGGKLLVMFAIAVFALLFVQNAIGVGLMSAMGQNPLIGLLGGSISLSGGHGTAGGWGNTFMAKPYNFAEARDIGIACATYGLIAGGVIGGPMAHYLIKKFNLKPSEDTSAPSSSDEAFASPEKVRLITSESFITSLTLVGLALFVGNTLAYATQSLAKATALANGVDKAGGVVGFLADIPTFVWCLFSGIIIRNGFSALRIHQVFDREVGVIGNVALSLFLSLAIMTLNLVELIKLAVPITILLIVQTIAIIIYTRYVTFNLCGRNYDAACIVAGHCGFGLGATPTAIANLQVVTNHFGPSRIAFLIVPIMGGFLVDLANVASITSFLHAFKSIFVG